MSFDSTERMNAFRTPASSSSSHPLWKLFGQFQDEVGNLLQEGATNVNKIAELENQLAVYKTAYHSVESKLNDAQYKIKLWTGFRIVTLLDGDGAIFSSDLIKRGKIGGQEAAQTLSEAIQKYVTTNYGVNPYQLSVHLFLNKQGLTDALGRTVTSVVKSKFEDFLMGFNQAAERFLVVDVGSDKEAADTKIKTHLQDAILLPQAYKIIFGGCHDNGYVTSLRSHITAGYKDKLILLKSYDEMAAGLAELDLPALTIPGLFSANKLTAPRTWAGPPGLGPTGFPPTVSSEFNRLSTSPTQPTFIPTSYSSALREGRRHGSTPDLDYGGSSASDDDFPDRRTSMGSRHVTPGLSLSKHNPPPCTLHYLSTCKHGADCKYGHDYLLNDDHLEEMKQNAKKSPCPAINNGEACPWGDRCLYGHHCPMRTKCHYYKVGTCKFEGADMHKAEYTKERW